MAEAVEDRSSARLGRSSRRAYGVIRTFVREHGRSPSLGELGLRLSCSRPRALVLVRELEAAGVITRTPGEAYSIELVMSGSGLSDVDLIDTLRDRLGEKHAALLQGVGAALVETFGPGPVTSSELATREAFGDLLRRLG